MLAIHCEGSDRGTKMFTDRKKFGFLLANDGPLQVVDRHSVTSTYLIDETGIIRAQWLDQVHQRVSAETGLQAVTAMRRQQGQPKESGAVTSGRS